MEKKVPRKWHKAVRAIAILVSDRISFKLKLIRRDKEDHFILIKGTIYQEDVIIMSIYAPNSGATNSVKRVVLDFKTQINLNSEIVDDFNVPPSPINMSFEQRIRHI